MKNKRLWAPILWLVMSLGIIAALPAGAETYELPSSALPALGKWKKMRPTSFAATAESALEQCQRDVAEEKFNWLTPEKCRLLYEKLTYPEGFLSAERCKAVLVPDGIVLDIMNGRVNGHSNVTYGVEKELGRYDRALLCPLGDGVSAYWFRDEPGSCNNVGFVHRPPPMQAEPASPVPSLPPAMVKRVPFSDTIGGSDSGIYLRSLVLSCCCGTDLYIPDVLLNGDSTLKSTGFYETSSD